MALSSEFVTLVQQEIPDGRKSLSDSHANLEKVAAYCIENFARAENKRAALEETKNYTTQSLASVAYQINTLAYNFLQMIEQQTQQLAEMESQVNHISQTVMIHKEKVARREIGVLTTNKTTARQYKILAPANTEKPIKYVRKPIDYTVLDDIGHGVRCTSSSTPRSRRSGSSVGMPPPSHHHPPTSAGPAPTTKPPTPPQANRSVSSLSRGSREYRTLPAVAPPQVPSNYAPNYPIGHPRRNDRSSGYSTLPHPSAAHVAHPGHNGPAAPVGGSSGGSSSSSGGGSSSGPQVGMVHPMSHGAPQAPYNPPPPPPNAHETPQYAANQTLGMPRYPTVIRPALTLPKNLTNKNMAINRTVHEVVIAPPSPASSGVVSELDYSRSSGASSPPLPPPPPQDNEPQTLVPATYLEKVIAVYDYTADKEDELSFAENAVIYVLKKNDDGWWEGVMNGVTGLFPGNYVEPLM
ncbi:abl interactor 2-like isoform X2 [Oratosquilla oratoria]|uniref:abl interactor 2-like isoform X2 n=1 Tax=Oratosquilla oratoria TaxID=337810 RepID=UPI003F767B30